MPGLRLHARTMTVQRAGNALHEATLKLIDDYDLSWIELGMILGERQHAALTYALRQERHPRNPGKKADEA